jgi:hypothetical protein
MKSVTATKLFRDAVDAGRVIFSAHALAQAEAAGLTRAFVDAEVLHAADGVLVPNKSHPGRFVAHGRATTMSVEVEPEAVIVTIMISE